MFGGFFVSNQTHSFAYIAVAAGAPTSRDVTSSWFQSLPLASAYFLAKRNNINVLNGVGGGECKEPQPHEV